MKRVLFFAIVVLILIGVGAAGWVHFGKSEAAQPKQLWTCGMHRQIVQDHPGPCPICGMPLIPLVAKADLPKGELLKAADSAVLIDPSVVQNMGVRTAKVTRGPLTKTVRVVGVLEIPETGQYDVNANVNGLIAKLYANAEGMHVHRGDVLFDLSSLDLLPLERQLVNLSGFPSFGNGASIRAVRQSLAAAGVAERDIDAIANSKVAPQTVPIRSPADGVVQGKMILEGSAVQQGMKLMRIEDHSKLWLVAQVFERELAVVKAGQIAQAMFESVPGKMFDGTVELVYPHLDPQTRTNMVRIMLDNPGDELKPGMYAQVMIETTPVGDALLAPREAVIDTGMRQIAFKALDGGRFEPVDVVMGISGDGDLVQILSGLKEGETIVTSGQFLLEATSRTNEALMKMGQDSPSH